MSVAWQNALVLMVVAVAAAYLARLSWQTLGRQQSSCGGCGTCPAHSAAEPAQVFGIESLAPSAAGAANANGRDRHG
ncbi:MAG TPA: FeoB-associated Cys-rich membrane protein [Pirellulales bacterium]|nr:FeoB-associated Cys-rich membrane protein [Pirellulales bacterium]